MKKIWLAGGCFWGVEAYFKQIYGTIATTVGYGQGQSVNPVYEEVCSGRTGHAEICEIIYDEKNLSLDKILGFFFRIIDPTLLNRQGNDIGTQYRTGIYYDDPSEASLIREFIANKQLEFTKPIVVEVEALTSFYTAETYHQDYLEKNPQGYCHINLHSVRDEEKK